MGGQPHATSDQYPGPHLHGVGHRGDHWAGAEDLQRAGRLSRAGSGGGTARCCGEGWRALPRVGGLATLDRTPPEALARAYPVGERIMPIKNWAPAVIERKALDVAEDRMGLATVFLQGQVKR